jgi:hypothetical protein
MPPNSDIEPSERGPLGGECSARAGVIGSGSAAHDQCDADAGERDRRS